MGRLMRNGKEYGGGAAGSGHEILNNSGTSMAQESKLQFKGQNVSDDSTNGKTIVTSTIECTQAEYDALVQAGNILPDVDYYISDASPVAIDAAHLPYDATISTKQKIDEVNGKLKYKPGDVISGTIIFNGWVQNHKSLSIILDKEMDSSITGISIQSTVTGGIFYLRTIAGLVTTTPNVAIQNVNSWNSTPNTSFGITFASSIVNSTLEQTPVVIAFDGSITFS